MAVTDPAAGRLWHVILTVGGDPVDLSLVRSALDRLSAERPFCLSGRYGADRAEVHYWEEAGDCADAAALALRLWTDHRRSADLPPWRVLGVEVVERAVYLHRRREHRMPLLIPAGTWRPFPSAR